MSQFKILPTTYILSPLTCFSKKRLFEELSNLASAVTGIKSATFLRALNEREWAGTTVCAKGVGLPHAVIPKLEQSIAVLAILQAEVPYNTVDSDYSGVDVALAFFISPKEKYETVENKLRLVSQELENTDLVNSLRRVWQENDKMMLILSKLDYELSLQIKPDEKPEAEESQSAANALLQFFTDTIINTISGDRDEDGENKQKSAKQQDANAIKASAQVDAQHVSQEDMALAKAIAATNPVFNADAQAKDGVMGELQNAAAASLAGDGASSHTKDKQDLIGAQQIAHIEKKELNEAKAETLGMGFSNLIAAVPAAPESPSLISSIMQALSDTFNDAVQGEDRQDQEKRKAIERIRAASTYVDAQRKVQDEDQSSAQGVVGVPQDYRPKSKKPAIAGSHDLLEHFRSPSATTNIKSFISDTFGRSLRGKEAQKAQDVFPAEAFIRVDEVPLEPPAPVSQVKPQELVDSSPLSAALNESYVDSYGSQDSTHLPSHEPYPYRVHPVEQQTVSGVAESNAATQTEEEHITLADIIAPPPASASSPATTAATANTNATVANIASVPAETAKVVEVAQSKEGTKEGTVVAPDTKQEAASLQSTADVALAENTQETAVSNEASANVASDGADATVAVTSEDEDGGKRTNMSPEAIRSITNSSMESQDGPRDGFIFGAAPSPEMPVADSEDAESDESDEDKSGAVAAVSAILTQLTSAISNVISSDKDSDAEEQAESDTQAEMANVTSESAESPEGKVEDASAAAATSQQESEEQLQASADGQIEDQGADQAQNEATEVSVEPEGVTDGLAVETVTGMPHQEESAEASATADEALLTVGGFAVGNQAAKETTSSAKTDAASIADATTASNSNEESEHGEKKKKDLWDKIVEIVTPQSQRTEKEQGSEGSDQVQDVVGDDESQTAEEQAVSEEEKAKAEAFAKALEIAAIGPRNPNLSVADVLGEEAEEQEDPEDYHGDQSAALAVAKEAAALMATVPKTVVTALSLDEVMAHEPTGVVPVQEQDKPDEPQNKGDCTATDDAKDTKDESSVLLQAPRRDLSNISITAALEAQLRQNHIPKPDPLSQDDVLAAENEARALTPRSIKRAVLAVTTARKEEAKDAVEAVKAEAEAFTAPAPEAVVATATTATEQQSLEHIVPEEVTPLKVDSEAEAVSAETVAPQVEPVEPEEDLGLTVEDVLGTAPAPEAVVATATAATTEQHAPEPIVPEEITPLQVPSENEVVSAETVEPQDAPVEPGEDLGLTVEDVLGTAPAPEAVVATATAATTEQHAPEPIVPEEITPLQVPSENEVVSAETVEPQDAPVEPGEDLGLTVEDVLGTAPAPEAVVATATAATTEQHAPEPIVPEEITPLQVPSENEAVSAETAVAQVESVEPEEDLGLTVEDVLGAEAAPKVDATVATAVTTEQQASEPVEHEGVTPLQVPSENEAVSAETAVAQVESVEPEEDLGLTVEDVLGAEAAPKVDATVATAVTTEQQASEPVEHEGVTPLKVDSEAEVVSAETDAPQVEPVEPEEDLGLTVEDVLGTAPAPEAVVATAATTEQQGLEPIEPKVVTPLKVPSEAEAVSAETVVPQVESVEQEEDIGLTVEDVLGSAEPESKSNTGAKKVKDL